MIRLTTDHSASSYGMPIFVDEKNNPLDYGVGLKQVAKDQGWTTKQLAEKLGVESPTIHNWYQGRRMIPKTALLLLSHLLQS